MAAEKINILIVEDESIVAMDLSTGLLHNGYHVTGIADNAVDARDLFEQNEVDIVLMDINLIGEKRWRGYGGRPDENKTTAGYLSHCFYRFRHGGAGEKNFSRCVSYQTVQYCQ